MLSSTRREIMLVAARRINSCPSAAAFSTTRTTTTRPLSYTGSNADKVFRIKRLVPSSTPTTSLCFSSESRRYCVAGRPDHYSNQAPPAGQQQQQQPNGRRHFRQDFSKLSSLGDPRQGMHEEEPSSPPKKQYDKKKKKSKKNKVQLFRADRVLANRSGKTRTECFKLLTKYAVSIVEDAATDNENDNDNSHTTEEDISQLNFRRLKGPKERIPMTARLFINQKFEVPSLPPLLTAYHKPKWCLSTMGDDPKGRRNLQDLSFPFAKQMHPVGRLDYDSSGLLLFSSSGPLTQTLLHPRYEKEKEYVAVVAGKVQEDELQAKLQSGVELADVSRAAKQERKVDASHSSESAANADAAAAAADKKRTVTTRAEIKQVQHLPSSQVQAYLEEIRSNLPEEYNVTDLNIRGYMDIFKAEELSEVRLVVQEGKHRMVRRMLASCGHPVVSLKRERMGVIELGDLKEGSFRNLTAEEEAWARSLVPSVD